MSANTFTFITQDGVEIVARRWAPDQVQPKAVVQIAHGMAEHIQRYDNFARHLVKHHFAVYGNDHRGHGLTGQKMGIAGYFADEDGFDRVVGDIEQKRSLCRYCQLAGRTACAEQQLRQRVFCFYDIILEH
ncbi:alpha-beta hydrolase superfamily lysophospholipase [Caldalkalibacillus uzonensis]|uniref:Alpha-beta hydrolase superfamily lysophospholipase n=1 Tax=Caldalkalibacillus uzonensis TaxID=353224 RepID=A0ABU0CUS3_9BACI|nr:alpha/beta hydrolase [Caldalkalibacillus uzonensis]MDQ0338777.1 alpha-beta hydrolase superfamily lysophospholipase [Caldalkalibacillus uzonensis]